MQSIVKTSATASIVALMSFMECFAAIVRVPADRNSIQSALNNIVDGDTILVSAGTYVEELTAPNFGFSLFGDVEPDTGLFARPIIDPSGLFEPTARSCLKDLRGNVVIERMWFRNGPPMFPHVESVVGGIKNESANLVMRDCVFDSTYRGVVSYTSSVTLERCAFRKCTRNCVYMANATLYATECQFESVETDWASVIGGPGTQIEHCNWHGDMGHWGWWLAVGGTNWHVWDNTFGPGGGSREALVRLAGPSGVFENNLFQNCMTQRALVEVQPQCGGLVEMRNNSFFSNLIDGEEWAGTMGVAVSAQYDSFTLCSQAAVIGNTFFANQGGSVVKGVLTVGHDIIAGNSFRELGPGDQWTVMAQDGDPALIDNMFFENGKAVYSEFGSSINAEYNFWGHSSGPFHPLLNPLGQGDEVGDNVDFDPWYMDTLFTIESVEPRALLPESASLTAFPNPFNAVTTLRLTLPRAGIARVELFDITGRRLKELWSGAIGETREIRFDGTNFASGMYFVRAWDPLGNRMWGATKIVILK